MDSNDFTGGVDESQSVLFVNGLGVELPASFKWFLTNYGSCGLFGVDILGVAKSMLLIEEGEKMILPKEFNDQWDVSQNGPLIKFNYNDLIEVNLSEEVKMFLSIGGLPETPAPYLEFYCVPIIIEDCCR